MLETLALSEAEEYGDVSLTKESLEHLRTKAKEVAREFPTAYIIAGGLALFGAGLQAGRAFDPWRSSRS